MGVSKFIHGTGLTGTLNPTASSVASTDAAPAIMAETRGTATLETRGKYAGQESTVYEVLVTSVTPDITTSEVTDVEFQGGDARPSDTMIVERVDLTAPLGTYSFECIDPGKEDQDAVTDYLFEDQGVRFKANSSVAAPIAVTGQNGNFLRIAVYALAPEYDDIGVAAAASYPRPSNPYFLELLNPVGFSVLLENRSVADFSKFSLFPQTWTYPDYPSGATAPIVPYINSEGNYTFSNTVSVDPVTGKFLPHLNTPRFSLGYPVADTSGSVTTETLLRQTFIGRVYSEYVKDSGDGTGELLFGIKGAARSTTATASLPDMPAGLSPIPVSGGYMVHVYLMDTSAPTADHLADFYYTHFPVKNQSGGTEWMPITTWGEFAYALDQHQQKGLYYTAQTTPITSGDLRYPLVLLESDTVVMPRQRRFSAWENADIAYRSGGTCEFPEFSGKDLQKISDFRILNRNVLRDEEIVVEAVEIVDDNAIFEVRAPATCALPSAPIGLGNQVIARLTADQQLQAVLAAQSATFASLFGLDFVIPPAGTQGGGTVTTTSEPSVTYSVSLVNDSPEEPRGVYICAHHLNIGPGMTKPVTVTAVFTKYIKDTCEQCADWIPDGYNDDCLGAGVGSTGANSGTESAGDITYTVDGVKIAPTPVMGKYSKTVPLFPYKKYNWVVNSGVATVLNEIDAAISNFEDLAFKLAVIDRSGVDPTFRRDTTSPNYTILLGGEEVLGGPVFPTNQLDPFCEDLTSGCTPFTTDADDGKSYSSWGTMVIYGLNRPLTYPNVGGKSVSGADDYVEFLNGLALNSPATGPFQKFYQVLNNYSAHAGLFDETAESAALWGASAPAILSDSAYGYTYGQEWVESGYDYYVPLHSGHGRDFDWHLYYFRRNFLDKLSNLAGVSPYDIVEVRTEADQLIQDWLAYTHDPGLYVETKYSTHSSWHEIFRWLYRLPQTHGQTGDPRVDRRHTELAKGLGNFAFSQGAVSADNWRVKVSFTYNASGYSYDWQTTAPPGGVSMYPYTQPAVTENRTNILTFSSAMSEAEVLVEIQNRYNGIITNTLDTFEVQPGYFLEPTPSSWTEQYTLNSYVINKVQNLDTGLTDEMKSRIGSLLAGIVSAPSAIPGSEWEAFHLHGLQSEVRMSEARNGKRSFIHRDPHSFCAHGAMDQIFWLRLIKLIVKCGYRYDVASALTACPVKVDYTNYVGCTASLSTCEHPSYPEDYWKVTVADTAEAGQEPYPAAYTNITYYDLAKHRFSFLVACRCPEQLEYGDTVVINYVPAGSTVGGGTTKTYSVGDRMVVRTRSGRKLVLADGFSDLDTATWKFKSPEGTFPDLDVQVLNRVDTVATIPSSSLFGLFSAEMRHVTRFTVGDKFVWSLSGGKFVVYRSDGAIYGPTDLTRSFQEFFAGDNIELGFSFNSREPFAIGDRWLVNLFQTNAPSHAASWDLFRYWRSTGNTDETLAFDLGTPTSIHSAVVVSNLSTSGTLILEGKNTADAWGSPPFQQTLTIYGSAFSGLTVRPAVYLNLTGTTAYQQWRIRATDATQDYIQVRLFQLANNTNGTVNLVYDQDPEMGVKLTTNDIDAESNKFKVPGMSFDVTYNWLTKASFETLWGMMYSSKLNGNRPFVWVPNYNDLQGAHVCRFVEGSLAASRPDGFLKTSGDIVYTGISVPLKVVNL